MQKGQWRVFSGECIVVASLVARFVQTIIEIFAANDITTLDHIKGQEYEDMLFGEQVPGGRKTFIREVLAECGGKVASTSVEGIAAVPEQRAMQEDMERRLVVLPACMFCKDLVLWL